MENLTTEELKKKPIEELFKDLGTSPEGLSGSEVEKRLTQFGKNEIVESKTKPLLFAVIITQTIVTLIVISGFLLPAMSWQLALFVWGYALAAFVITDFIKVHVYKILDHTKIKFKN